MCCGERQRQRDGGVIWSRTEVPPPWSYEWHCRQTAYFSLRRPDRSRGTSSYIIHEGRRGGASPSSEGWDSGGQAGLQSSCM